MTRIYTSFPHLARLVVAGFLLAGPAHAQDTEVAFGSVREQSDLPVEVTSDSLSVDQGDGTAVFTGGVVIGQGDMRLSAPRVEIVYREGGSGISRMRASGGVTLVSGEDAAEAARAEYDIDSGVIEMQGDVLLVQGRATLTADRVTVDTEAGVARMTGRVRTVLEQQEEAE